METWAARTIEPWAPTHNSPNLHPAAGPGLPYPGVS
jgi:hypothetical protein